MRKLIAPYGLTAAAVATWFYWLYLVCLAVAA